jgi:hypothetical protein
MMGQGQGQALVQFQENAERKIADQSPVLSLASIR